MRILLVEDEAEMAAALASALKRYDMVVDHVATLAEAEEAIVADVHGAVLLDRQLPDGDGLALIPKLRARTDGVPIIVLTARGGWNGRDFSAGRICMPTAWRIPQVQENRCHAA